MTMRRFISLLIAVCLCFFAFSSPAYAADPAPPQTSVTKVQVNFLCMDPNGNWVNAESWTAQNGGTNTKKLAQASKNAYDKIAGSACIDNVEYTFDNYWIDDFGNEYGTSGKLVAKDFIEMFEGQEGPIATLNIYAQYQKNYKYNCINSEIDKIGNGSHQASFVADSKTGYSYTFSTPADIPERYSFLYWNNETYGQKKDGDILTIEPNTIHEETIIEFIATYEYTLKPTIQVIYKSENQILKIIEPTTESINLKENAPKIENLDYWSFEKDGIEVVSPDKVEPMIVTEPVTTEDPIKTIEVCAVLKKNEPVSGGTSNNDTPTVIPEEDTPTTVLPTEETPKISSTISKIDKPKKEEIMTDDSVPMTKLTTPKTKDNHNLFWMILIVAISVIGMIGCKVFDKKEI